LRRTNRRLKVYAPKGGGFYHLTLKGTKEFTDNKGKNSVVSVCSVVNDSEAHKISHFQRRIGLDM
jgi:hypothetical protein